MTTDAALIERAAKLYPTSFHLQNRWLMAIAYLREHSRAGWVLDRRCCPTSKRHLRLCLSARQQR